MNVLPEAHALRRFRWQIFATLTFMKPPQTPREAQPRVFTWLRRVAKVTRIHFHRLLWVSRFEIGPRGGSGHYHLCIAGIPRALFDSQLCRNLASAWRAGGGGLSEVAAYDQARDGLGYILKLPTVPQELRLWRESRSGKSGTDHELMLSKSLFPTKRRGRM